MSDRYKTEILMPSSCTPMQGLVCICGRGDPRAGFLIVRGGLRISEVAAHWNYLGCLKTIPVPESHPRSDKSMDLGCNLGVETF